MAKWEDNLVQLIQPDFLDQTKQKEILTWANISVTKQNKHQQRRRDQYTRSHLGQRIG